MPTDVNKFERECLEAHNTFRAQHGCPPLRLNSKLSARARNWAENLAKSKTLESSTGHNFGENLYMAEGIHVDGARPVKTWYDENEDYDFEAAKFVQGAAHFTQLIWKTTQDLGVGVATNNKVTVVVTNYFKPGNVHGQFKENVPRKIDQKETILLPSTSEGSISITTSFLVLKKQKTNVPSQNVGSSRRSSRSEGSVSITSSFLELQKQTANVLSKNMMSSTRTSRSHDWSIPIEMVSAATIPRVSTVSYIPISSSQLVLHISSETLEGTDTGSLGKEETKEVDLNTTSNDIQSLSFPNNEENSSMQQSKKPRGVIAVKQEFKSFDDQNIEHGSTSAEPSQDETDMLYVSYSNIVLAGQNKSRPQPATSTIRHGISRQTQLASKKEDTVPAVKPVKEEPRSSTEHDNNLLYTSFSYIVLENQKPTTSQPSTAPTTSTFARQDAPYKRELGKAFSKAPKIGVYKREQSTGVTNATMPRAQIVKQGQIPTKSNETDRNERTSAKERKFLSKTSTKIVEEAQDPSYREQFQRQNSVSQKEKKLLHRQDLVNEQDTSSEIEVSSQDENREIAATTSLRTQTPIEEPGTSNALDMVHKSTNAHEKNREISAATMLSTQTLLKEPGPSRVPAILHKSTSTHETERNLGSSANERQLLNKIVSDIVVGSQDPKNGQQLRRQEPISQKEQNQLSRQDSITQKDRDKSHIAEVSKQAPNKEKAATSSPTSQASREEPGPSRVPAIIHKSTSTHETERHQGSSANDKKLLKRRVSDIVVGRQEPKNRKKLPTQDPVSQKEQKQLSRQNSITQKDRNKSHIAEISKQAPSKEKAATSSPTSQTTRKEPVSSRVPDIVHKSTSAHEIEMYHGSIANDRKLLKRRVSDIVVGSQGPRNWQQLRRQDAMLQKVQKKIPRQDEKQEPNKEKASTSSPTSQTTRKEPVSSKVPDIVHKSTSAHETERHQGSNANDRKLLRRVSDIAVGSQGPRNGQQLRRHDPISQNAKKQVPRQDPKQEPNKEKASTSYPTSQTARKEPVSSRVPEIVHKSTSAHEIERHQGSSANDRKLLRRVSDIVVGSQGPKNEQQLRRQDPISQNAKKQVPRQDSKQEPNKEKAAASSPTSQTTRKEPVSSRVPDVVHKSTSAHETERHQGSIANDRNLLKRRVSDIVVGSQEPRNRQHFQRRNSFPRKDRNMSHITDISKQKQDAAVSKTTHTTQLPRKEPGLSRPDMIQETSPANETQKQLQQISSNDIKSQESQKLTTEEQKSDFKNEEEHITKPDFFKGIEAIRQAFAKQVHNKEIPPNTTLSIQTACKSPKNSAKPNMAYTKGHSFRDDKPTTSAYSAKLTSSEERLRKPYELSFAECIFHHECLCAHNFYRVRHGSPPLQLCEQLTIYATKWAQELINLDQLLYSPNEELGENIYMAAGIRVSGCTPVKAWYNEIEDYDFKKAECTPCTGHFTQVIWKDTRELGVGVCKNEKCCIVVASYFPPGNEAGQFKENVLPLRKCTCKMEQKNNSLSNDSSNSLSNGSSKSSSKNSSNDSNKNSRKNSSNNSSNSYSKNSSNNSSNSSSKNSSNSPSNNSRTKTKVALWTAGVLLAGVAAAAGGWMIYNKQSIPFEVSKPL